MTEEQRYGQVEVLAETIVETVESAVAELGWDQPAHLFEVRGVDVPPEHLSDLDPDGDYMTMGFELSLAEDLDGHPYEQLIGRTADPEVLAVALTVEGWDYPGDVKTMLSDIADVDRRQILAGLPPPSQHPARVEVRLCHVLFRDQTQASIVHHRGSPESDVQVHPGDHSHLEGRVVDALYRYLDLPTTGDIDTTPVDITARTIGIVPVLLGDVLRTHQLKAFAAGLSKLDPSSPDGWRALAELAAIAPELGPVPLVALATLDGVEDWTGIREWAISELETAVATHGTGAVPVEMIDQLRWFDARMLALTAHRALPAREQVADLARTAVQAVPELAPIAEFAEKAAAAYLEHSGSQ